MAPFPATKRPVRDAWLCQGLVVALTCATAVVAASPAVRLDGYRQHAGRLQLDKGFTGKPLLIGTQTYARGLGTHADSVVKLTLPPGCRTFHADVGVDGNAKQRGAVVFTVITDARVAFRSTLLHRGMQPVPVTVDLADTRDLFLIVDSVRSPAGDHADWAAARLVMADGHGVLVSDAIRGRPIPEPDAALAAPRSRAISLSVTDYGATGDGKTDDSPAFQRALDEVAHAGRGVVLIPPGEYRLARALRAELTGPGIAIRGQGQGVSVLVCDNPDGVFLLHAEWCDTQVTVHDLSILAGREGAGTALELSSPPRGARNVRTLTVRHVDIRGTGLPSRRYFDCGVDAPYQWRPLFTSVVVSGPSDPALKADQSDSSPLYRMACGIRADGSYAPSFQHCYVWNATTGYSVVTEGRDEGPEDSAFYRCFAVGCRTGIDIRTPIPEPQLVIDSCHINCRDTGIRLGKRKFFHLTGNLMYGQPADGRPYTDIELTGSFCGVITGNVFHDPDGRNYRPTPEVARTMISVDALCRDLVIEQNIFNAKGLSLAIDPKATRIATEGNQYPNSHTRRPPP